MKPVVAPLKAVMTLTRQIAITKEKLRDNGDVYALKRKKELLKARTQQITDIILENTDNAAADKLWLAPHGQRALELFMGFCTITARINEVNIEIIVI